MSRKLNVIYTLLICFLVSGNVSAQEAKLKITPLTGDFYIYTTYSEYKGSRIGANGMYVITREGAIIIDSPWDTTQFQPLLDSIKAKHNKTAVMCMATHFHEDRTGGLEYYRRLGIKTYTTRKTDELSKQRGMKRAEFLIDKDTLFSVGQYSFKTIYPGKGHAPDNIVIWFEKEKILYGGCLIKSVEDETLGNLNDASINDYPTTIKNVQAKCKNPAYVIPGHNDWNNPKSLAHTLKMAEQLTGQSDSLLYSIEFIETGGCSAQLQSFNPGINGSDLKKLMSILNLASPSRGLRNEFYWGTFFDIRPDKSRDFYEEFSNSSFEKFKDSCLKLKNLEVPQEFNELRDTILVSYLKRLSYENVIREWISDNNGKKLKEYILSIRNNDEVRMILDSIETKNSFHDKLWIIQFKLYNYLNKEYFPYSVITNTEARLLNKHKLRIQSEECED